ncbi:hypothetical protein A3A48_02880 [Candidatus Curtissbacteria bacterium RIFCSPLOWO2_01_FULL_37_9]|uniref:Uncharacterized protein n=1 Tax=Candidatus Curtissbacteria bacterium RIFCSPLOWO2_01_FULL_37_9 TaxID=1797724 RepID=A0A1F5GTL3_9BACT|nr:MAG: hypothetical protein A3A48_02880 [Candidatus Curtissbacteria bacterium RIFCSPLOWO2_01_FULL_37_9]
MKERPSGKDTESAVEINKNHPYGIWTIDINLEGDRRQIPVFDCRDDSHKETIAQLLANYKVAAAFGVGLYGFSALVEDPRVGRNPESWKVFYQAKIGRSLDKRIPIQATPKNLYRYMDKSIVHPEFQRYFDSRESREDLYKAGVAFHIMSPIPQDAYYIHPVFIQEHKVFLTDKNGNLTNTIKVPCVSLCWWHDPDWEEISDRVEVLNPHATAGISSANASGKLPAFDFDGIVYFIEENHAAPFHFVVKDSENEVKKRTKREQVRSSFPQFRPAFVGEKPEWVVLREGAISMEGFLKAINSPFSARTIETTTMADRDHANETVLDEKVFAVRESTIESFKERHPSQNTLETLKGSLMLWPTSKDPVMEYVERELNLAI